MPQHDPDDAVKVHHRLAKAQIGLLHSLAKPRVSAADPDVGYKKKTQPQTNNSSSNSSSNSSTLASTRADTCSTHASTYSTHATAISTQASTYRHDSNVHRHSKRSLNRPETTVEGEEDDYHADKVPSHESADHRREVLEVAALHHQGPVLNQRSSDRLVRQALSRRVKHEAAVEKYEARVRDTTDDLEEKVLSVSRDVREALEATDGEIKSLFARLKEDVYLVSVEESEVQTVWQGVEALLGRRTQEIVVFASALEGIELSRLELVGAETKRLVDELVAIAHKSVNDVERLAEGYTSELNMVMVSNRQAHAELVAMLQKLDIVEREKGRAGLVERQRAWARLKHDRAVAAFHTDINSDVYTNPPGRQALLATARQEHEQRHTGRMSILGQLAKQTHPALASAEVATIAGALKDLHVSEEANTNELLDALDRCKQESVSAAEARREDLRAELHKYAHLAPEPNLKFLAAKLEGTLSRADAEVVLKSGGDLKGELKALLKAMQDEHGVMYAEVLDPAIARVEHVLNCVGLDDTLRAHGKAHVKKNMQDMLGLLRKAHRGEASALWVPLEAQVKDVASVPTLNESLKKVLDDVLPLFQKAYDVPDLGPVTGGRAGTAGTGTGKHSRTSTPSGAGSDTPTSASSSSPGRSGRSLFGMSGPEMDMGLLRSVQKRLALVVYLDSLPAETKACLQDAYDALKQKRTCNELVDGVVAQETAMPMEKRQSEQTKLIDHIRFTLTRHNTYLHAVGERLTDYYTSVAIAVEEDRKDNDRVNATSVSAMQAKLDAFAEEDKAREDDVAKKLDRVRHAADEKELETNFEAALRILKDVEKSYRVYHKEASALAGEHVRDVQLQNIRHRGTVCDLLGLGSPEIVPLLSPTQTLSVSGTLSPSRDKHARPSSSKGKPASKDGKRKIRVSQVTEAAAALVEPAEDPFTFRVNPGVKYHVNRSPGHVAEELLAPLPHPDDPSPSTAEGAVALAAEQQPVVFQSSAVVTGKGAKKPAKWWRPPFVPLTEDDMVKLRGETPHLVDVYLDQRDQAFVVLEEKEVGSLDEKSKGEYEALRREVEQRNAVKLRARQERERIQQERQRLLATPRDKDGDRCIVRHGIAPAVMSSMLIALRESVIRAAEAETAERESKSSELREQRLNYLTEELEGRLRMHWPRKGRTEVSHKDPRESELIAHRNKAERHVRTLTQRNVAHEDAFAKLISEALAHCESFKIMIANYEAQLPLQTSQAAFQGLDMRCKRDIAAFRPRCEEHNESLRLYTTSEPSRLLATNHELLKICKLFMEGGDYDQAEVDLLKAMLDRPTQMIEESIEARVRRVEEVTAAQDAASGSVKAYRDAYDKSVLELCLREGLGPKYGAPRRAAQERVRTEMTRDDNHAKQLDGLLQTLEGLCRRAQSQLSSKSRRVSYRPTPPSNPSDEPLSVSIRKALLALRKCTYKRGMYLESLKTPSTVKLDQAVPLDLEGEGNGQDIEVAEITVGTFRGAVCAMEDECKAVTKRLYEADGKESLLGADGLPDSLRAWLEERRGKTLGEGGYRAAAIARFEGQLQMLERLIGKIPPPAGVRPVAQACLDDIWRRARSSAHKARVQADAAFAAQLKQWDVQRDLHRCALRPRLGTPDAGDELHVLLRQETVRSDQAKREIEQTKKALLQSQTQAAKEFVARLNASVKTLLAVFDTLAVAEDVGECSEPTGKEGKSSAKPKRASMLGEDPNADSQRNGWQRKRWEPLQAERIKTIFAGVEGTGNCELWLKETQDASAPYSFDTKVHELLVRARDESFQDYMEYLRGVIAEAETTYGEHLEKELTWDKCWESLVTSLVNSTNDIV